ncbi:MAG: helix-turn-helix domain-containing protein [Bacteroidales bacterium]
MHSKCRMKPNFCFSQGSRDSIIQSIIAFEMPFAPNATQLIMPNPTNGLILQYGTPSYYSFDGVNFEQFPRFYFALPSISRKSMLLKSSGHYKALLVIFKPGIISSTFNFPLSDCSNSFIIDANHIIPPKMYDRIKLIMECRASLKDIIYQLHSYLQNLQNPDLRSDITIQATNQIIAAKGIISLPSLSQQLGISIRTLERKFKFEQGVSPNTYSRLVKHHSILREIHANRDIDWFDIVVRYKFHDRAHYINDFKKITGINSLLNNKYSLQLDEKTRFEF